MSTTRTSESVISTIETSRDHRGSRTPKSEASLTQSGLGLANIGERAEKLGGTFEIHPRSGGGTRLLWTVPL
jgi:signal transduction histidine kinase